MECNQEYRGRKHRTHAWEFLALEVLHMHTDESIDGYLILIFLKMLQIYLWHFIITTQRNLFLLADVKKSKSFTIGTNPMVVTVQVSSYQYLQ